MSILFFKENVRFRITKKEFLIKWINRQVKKYGYKIDDLNFIFCNDKYLRSINKQYLQHDYFTDIITFDNSIENKNIIADIFISIDTVENNAKTFGVNFKDELHRVMAHGVLHLLGFSDKNPKHKKQMSAEEDKWLSARTWI